VWDGEACDGFFAWHIVQGEKDGVNLTGLNVVMARHRPKDLAKDRWLVELYLDERAGPEQADALAAIFGGKAGGHIAAVFQRIGAITGVHTAPIGFEKAGAGRRVRVGSVLEVQAQELVGMDGKNPTVIDNPTVWAVVAQPVRQGKADAIHYAGAWAFDAAGTNSFITEFRYDG
ncbi:MAG: DUF1326 domain-containing protein, partial [Armatimonadetes bacterium]|nr:DUF1326 domain-containing protein [Armatimonadota bacterium]